MLERLCKRGTSHRTLRAGGLDGRFGDNPRTYVRPGGGQMSTVRARRDNESRPHRRTTRKSALARQMRSAGRGNAASRTDWSTLPELRHPEPSARSCPMLKVLIVDDQPAVCAALQLLFELHDIPSLIVHGARDALDLIANEDIGVVVQDMNFTQQNTDGEEGTTLFRAIKKLDPDLPTVLLTAWSTLEAAVQLVKEGANDYMAKPWDDRKLVRSVQNLIQMRALKQENTRIQAQGRLARRTLAARYDLRGLIYTSEQMHNVVRLAVTVATSDAPILITGPNGSGKEKLAEIIQANSRRKDRPFVRVNVGALPENLFEAELFGAEAGAYTGANKLRVGRFEAADGGT